MRSSDVIEIDEHCLSGKGYPPHAFRLTQKFREYVLFMQKCLMPYDKESAMSDNDQMLGLVMASGRMCPKGEIEIRSEAGKGSPEDILELGVRCYTGQGGPPKNPKVGLEQWLYLIDPERGLKLATPPNRRILSQAHSCIAWYYIEKVHSKRTLNMDDLTRAAEAADAAASLGYFTPAVISVAEYVDNAKDDESGKCYWEIAPFDGMQDLRRVYERRQREDWKEGHKSRCKPGPPTPPASDDAFDEEDEV
ncbi:uncharacterized protein B0H18DRAFT_1117352 [Fomitopsis serialis]|uniref:uncharacterized protein n=1 Tax=Fomitopsis serialis TaxID=139415 RepID=UPI0020080296|nr:uncharacterized protein B0H18DRAFT_1117352 [Neoantrodia serialis]KAH9929825.1 hypothetical protein B0H18DRAFT_1117352 [Neoantrodia serialis]